MLLPNLVNTYILRRIVLYFEEKSAVESRKPTQRCSTTKGGVQVNHEKMFHMAPGLQSYAGCRLKPKKGKCLFFSILLACVVLPGLFIWAAPGLCSDEHDPWYVDADVHWAGNYIYVLWLENVTDGYVTHWGGYYRAYFSPDDPCTRAQFLVLLAKTFGLSPENPASPTYPDVPPNYYILSYKPAYGWIEAAVKAGITFVPRGSKFEPERPVSREDAVDLLIRSLDLYEDAQSMSPSEVSELLRRFRDGMTTSPQRRNTMAAAIKYGIIDGYDDDTIRPQALLLRCHAATIVYRSCLIRMSARKDFLTPDGDGVDDTVTFNLSYLKNRGISTWNAVIEDSSGKEIFSFNPNRSQGYPPATLTWDGRKSGGTPVAPGVYYYQAMVVDRSNRQFISIRKPLRVLYYKLQGYLYPSICKTGQTLTIKVSTEPTAASVQALFKDNTVRYFSPDNTGKTAWTLERMIQPSLPDGLQDVVVTAAFQDTSRTITLQFTKEPDLWLNAWISPNTASWGQTIALFSETSTNAESVTVNLLGQTIPMSKQTVKTDSITWNASVIVPEGTPEKDYPAVFTGKFRRNTLSRVVTLTISNQKLKDLVFTLTK